MANIEQDVRYQYFFRAGATDAWRWVTLVRTLLLAAVRSRDGSIETDTRSKNSIIKATLATYQDLSMAAIDDLTMALRIHLLGSRSAGAAEDVCPPTPISAQGKVLFPL